MTKRYSTGIYYIFHKIEAQNAPVQ